MMMIPVVGLLAVVLVVLGMVGTNLISTSSSETPPPRPTTTRPQVIPPKSPSIDNGRHHALMIPPKSILFAKPSEKETVE